MSERDKDPTGEPQSPADRTLMGVAPPKLDGSGDPALRSPVFVRSGTSVADVEPPPLPRMALPSRPPRAEGANASFVAGEDSAAHRALRLARAHPVLWMVAAPSLVAVCVIGLLIAVAPTPKPKQTVGSAAAVAAEPTVPATESKPAESSLPSLAELEAKPLGALTAAELIRLAEGRVQRRQQAARTLSEKLAQSPTLAADKGIQTELLHAARDAETAPIALAALAAAGTPLTADLLYEVWTGTPARTEATELARGLLYSRDVRSKASPALAVALELRAAETCEHYKAALPSALKDGDRRSLHLLGKLVHRRGCGPKKTLDCYACLRDQNDELTATINAAKSRRAPVTSAP